MDVLASRSMFDGYVTESGTKSDDMDQIMKRNHLIAEYNKAVKEELLYGCAFAAVSGTEDDARIRFLKMPEETNQTLSGHRNM